MFTIFLGDMKLGPLFPPPPPRCFFPALSFVAKHGCVTARRVPHFSRWKFSETWRFTWSTWNFRYLGWWKHGHLVGGWTNPSEQYESKWESSPGSGENENLFQNHHLVMHPFTSGYCVLLLPFQAGQKWGKIGSSERFNFLRWLFLILYVDSSCELNELPDLSYQQWQRPTPSVFFMENKHKNRIFHFYCWKSLLDTGDDRELSHDLQGFMACSTYNQPRTFVTKSQRPTHKSESPIRKIHHPW